LVKKDVWLHLLAGMLMAEKGAVAGLINVSRLGGLGSRVWLCMTCCLAPVCWGKGIGPGCHRVVG
jgi:hypothetical protein